MRWMLLIVLALTMNSTLHAEDFKAGVAVRDITPPTGYRMCGYFYERLNTGTHDPLYAKAIVWQQGDTQAALVFCDLIGLYRPVSDKARQMASERTKIPVENIVVAATHSHTGPLYDGVLRDYFHQQAIAKHGEDPAEKLIDYPNWLADRIADAIVSAHKVAAPVQIGLQTADQRGLSFNRRFHMKDGSVRFNPGRLNPDIVRVAGPIDPEVNVLRFTQGDNHVLANLCVFALHLDTIGGTDYSADYPQYLDLGGVTLFGAGTCGDINHVDVTTKEQPAGQAMAKHVGTTLTKTVQAASSRQVFPKLAVKSSTIECPLQQYPAEKVAIAKTRLPKVGTQEFTFLEQVEACKILALDSLQKEKLACEVQVFRLSDDTAIVCLPGEVFVDLGLAIKTASPFANTIVIELCNDVPGYIPTKKAFAEGSYETVNSILSPGGGEMLVEEAVKLLKAL